VDSDPEDIVDFGRTSYGTPVHITRVVARADRRILVGNIEYHYFAGYSGGAKALMPGVSSREAIQANHSRMIEPTSVAGAISKLTCCASIWKKRQISAAAILLSMCA
jgi:lactate racemase